MMVFLAPWALLLLLLLPLFYCVLSRAHVKTLRALDALCGERYYRKPSVKPLFLQTGAVALLIFALARPAWNPHPTAFGVQGRDLLIALDISRSMLAADVYPDRLEVARFVLLESLPGFRGQRLGLITFAGSSSVRVPLTLDHNFMRYVLERVQPADAEVGSTSLQAAIEKAIDVVLEESERGRQDIIILTDGEDHISDVDRIVELLREWGARVLIVGIGDPTTGARIPDFGEDGGWIKYKEREVISRLDEVTLRKLAAAAPGIVYHSAGTAAFDLIALYRDLLSETSDLVVGDQTRVVYDEGFQYCLALALILLLLAYVKPMLPIVMLTLCYVGCERPVEEHTAVEYQRCMNEGIAAWSAAQSTVAQDPVLAVDTLQAVREFFLQAALHRKGDLQAARHIAGVTAQIHEAEQVASELRETEDQLQQILQEAIAKLEELTLREERLYQQARELLRTYPPPAQELKSKAAVESGSEQGVVASGTLEVRESITVLQNKVHKMMQTLFKDDQADSAVTEYDEVVELLTAAGDSQQGVLDSLNQRPPLWDEAGSELVTAVRQMQQALEILTDQQSGDDSENSTESGEMDDYDYDENMEWSDSAESSSLFMPLNSSTFNSSLDARNMPVPNYTAEEIMAEEQQNALERSRRNEQRAGANVEKNW